MGSLLSRKHRLRRSSCVKRPLQTARRRSDSWQHWDSSNRYYIYCSMYYAMIMPLMELNKREMRTRASPKERVIFFGGLGSSGVQLELDRPPPQARAPFSPLLPPCPPSLLSTPSPVSLFLFFFFWFFFYFIFPQSLLRPSRARPPLLPATPSPSAPSSVQRMPASSSVRLAKTSPTSVSRPVSRPVSQRSFLVSMSVSSPSLGPSTASPRSFFRPFVFSCPYFSPGLYSHHLPTRCCLLVLPRHIISFDHPYGHSSLNLS